ncbi:hypothetical protein [Thiorhodococcus minor]|uniref:Uncharacterized protein n=1 Tax=Thiorhodococcus minor TaxID=57489 RepID=A0A6M0K8C3_9GAMM|nr:hypothetical protein [Thiorhodococcus minor]NEV65263.1 hypothetical protein [Thiorhodococcus minor]
MPRKTLTDEERRARTAERQRRYRERAFKDPDGHQLERLSIAVSAHAKAQLGRLATGYAVTLREALELALDATERHVLAGLSSQDQERYLNRELALSNPLEQALPGNGEEPEPTDLEPSMTLPGNAQEPEPTDPEPPKALLGNGEAPKVEAFLGYPEHVKAKAVEMRFSANYPHKQIADFIQAECGRAPSVSNLPKLLKRWAQPVQEGTPS